MRQQCSAAVAIGLFALTLVQSAFADPKQEYIELAKLLSHEFRINGKPATEMPQHATLEKLAASNDVAVQRAAKMLLHGLRTAEKRLQEAEKSDEAARAQETLAAIERGDFTRKETYLEYDARGNLQGIAGRNE